MSVGTTVVDGIETRYEVAGSGPPLMMFSPGGFNGSMANWLEHGLYRRTRMLTQLRERFSCITFDKRESGESGGRVERISWQSYVEQAVGLLDHLGIDRVPMMGACVGCSIVAGMATTNPERISAMVLYSPAGGVRYRRKQHARFHAHLGFVAQEGLKGVVELADATEAGFSEDGRVGPWVMVLRRDREFRDRYLELNTEWYLTVVAGISRLMFDRDTVPGAEPEDLLALDIPALIVPGQDSSHAPSAARYLQECLRSSEYWDVPVAEQTDRTAPAKVSEFLGSVAL